MSFFKDLVFFLDGFRKLTICFLVLLLASGFLISGHITGTEFVNMLNVVIPAYFASNVGEHVTNAIKDFLNKGKRVIKDGTVSGKSEV